LRIRELPPLRQSTVITTPGGRRRFRWAEDERDPANVPAEDRCSDTMPGGFERKSATLARNPAIDYADLERLSTITDYDAAGNIIWQGRLERAPRSSGDRIAISPEAVGWQAHLEDDQSATELIIDRSLDRWQGMSRARRIGIGTTRNPQGDAQATPDDTNGAPALKFEITGHIPGASGGLCEAFYDAGDGNLIGQLQLEATDLRNVSGSTWSFITYLCDDDTTSGATILMSDQDGASVAFRRDSAATARRWALIQFAYDATYTGDENERWRMVKNIAVVGDHALPLQAVGAGEDGYLASDIVRHVVERWAPMLKLTDESIRASDFAIPQFAQFDPTTAAELLRQATRYGLEDWAVWDDLVLWWHPRGSRGRSWRARVGPAQLEETGPQLDRLWESVIVQYRDVDGSTRTVGPPGSGAGSTSADLKDTDPENPANKLGITRRVKLDMGIGTAASATEIGRRFLIEQKQLDSSGRATLVGHVMDDRGVLHPYTAVRSGDDIVFTDASNPSPRRIVRTEKTRATRSCAVDLDSPPEGMAALLERLGVVLVPLGL
jgi:hypothetical protein